MIACCYIFWYCSLIIQVVGWLAVIAFLSGSYCVLVPALRRPWQQCALSVLSSLYALHAACHLAAIIVDPAEPAVRRRTDRYNTPEFDRAKHAHVIENGNYTNKLHEKKTQQFKIMHVLFCQCTF